METLENVRNNSKVKIYKSRTLRAKYKIKRPEEIQNVLEKIKQTIQAKAEMLRQYQKNLVSEKIKTYLKTIRNNSIEITVNHKSK